MREKVLMAKHVSQDPRFRRGGGLAKAKAKGKAKAASKSAVSSLAKKKFHQTVVRGSDAASSVLNETLSEALENIVSTLVSNPDRILLMQKFVRNEKLFTSAKVSTKEGYLHNTLLVMSQSPKKLWKDSLVAASEKYHDKRKCWTATLLTACDKAEGLQGVEQMLVALADLADYQARWQDRLGALRLLPARWLGGQPVHEAETLEWERGRHSAGLHGAQQWLLEPRQQPQLDVG